MTASPAYQRGNAAEFSPDTLEFNPAAPLSGKKIAFLGSSVTYGAAAKGVSFVDYLQARDGVVATKSAISGTTLAGTEKGGYLQRLHSDFPKTAAYDLFVCQLSTNDNRHGKPLGHATSHEQRTDFDVATTIGAIEEICRYVTTTFQCPLVFYTCLQRDPHHEYANLIHALKQLRGKWNFHVLDLFHNEGLLASTAAHPSAMYDDVHPTQAGYRQIWLPVFEQNLPKFLQAAAVPTEN